MVKWAIYTMHGGIHWPKEYFCGEGEELLFVE